MNNKRRKYGEKNCKRTFRYQSSEKFGMGKLQLLGTARVEVPDSCPDFEGRAASRFRPKLHNRAESLSLESLDMIRAVGRESLDIPKLKITRKDRKS